VTQVTQVKITFLRNFKRKIGKRKILRQVWIFDIFGIFAKYKGKICIAVFSV